MPESNYSNAVYWIDIGKIKPNPYQPRKTFDDDSLDSLAQSIKQYGILQPLIVIRQEIERPDGGIGVEYELVAGERRLRAAERAGLMQVPALIRAEDSAEKIKLELAIIENIQREDLNPVDRARAFDQLAGEFGLKHGEIAEKVGKSREYVSNSIRILSLPAKILESVRVGRMTEGHARSMLMLSDRPEEQETLYRDVLMRGLTVRETEQITRRLAQDKIRKRERIIDRDTFELEEELARKLGTRVQIEKRGEEGGKILIEFFSAEDLKNLVLILAEGGNVSISQDSPLNPVEGNVSRAVPREDIDPEDLYSVRNFTV